MKQFNLMIELRKLMSYKINFLVKAKRKESWDFELLELLVRSNLGKYE